MGFASLQHIRARRSTSARAFACPLRSALRVWLPSRRLTPFVTRAGFVSHRQRSWDSPFGAFSSRKVSGPFPTGRTHVPFRSPVYLRTRRCEGRLDEPRFLGFNPTGESLAIKHVFSTPTAGCSLGLGPYKVSCGCLDRDFARSPLTRFVLRTHARWPAPQSFDGLPLRLLRPTSKPAGVG
jgi:hypothetical protein